MALPQRYSILIINPNTSTHMTDALKPIIQNLGYDDIHFDYFTAPETLDTVVVGSDGEELLGIPSINNGEDSVRSALYCLPSLKLLVPRYDAFLVACYSAHPLVGMLKDVIREHTGRKHIQEEMAGKGSDSNRKKYVTGIFEASVSTSLALVSSYNIVTGFEKSSSSETFGIISTGKVWEEELSSAVVDMLSGSQGADQDRETRRFGGVETTGLTAVELHSTPAEEVHKRVRNATERLVRSSQVGAICLGCAGMAGMEEAVREGCTMALGPVKASRVRIVDGVVAGVGILVNACKAGF
jgi:Asp/Glu/hydantoin racemase